MEEKTLFFHLEYQFQNGLKIASGLPIEFVTDTIINEAPKNLYSMDEIFT